MTEVLWLQSLVSKVSLGTIIHPVGRSRQYCTWRLQSQSINVKYTSPILMLLARLQSQAHAQLQKKKDGGGGWAEWCGPAMYSGNKEKSFAEKLTNLKFWTAQPGFHLNFLYSLNFLPLPLYLSDQMYHCSQNSLVCVWAYALSCTLITLCHQNCQSS